MRIAGIIGAILVALIVGFLGGQRFERFVSLDSCLDLGGTMQNGVCRAVAEN